LSSFRGEHDKTLKKEELTKLVLPPNGMGHVQVGHNPILIPKEEFEAAKADGGVVTIFLMGFLQYSDDNGTHQTDYCVIYQGKQRFGPVSCDTHFGPSKPTPLL
jgi:hypothetical protein